MVQCKTSSRISIGRSQPFPSNGALFDNLDLSKSELYVMVRKCNEEVRPYVVRSIGWNRSDRCFVQQGSGPNFQGVYLTLCTCKHKLRTGSSAYDWCNTWVAGFTSRTLLGDHRHWLFYLAQVESAHESQYDLWQHFQPSVRNAKSTRTHYLGDLFEPRTTLDSDERFVPDNYFTPTIHSHHKNSCDNHWHNDIRYEKSGKYGAPSLLVFKPSMSFIWTKPIMYFDENLPRNPSRRGLIDFMQHLEEAY